MESAGEAHCEVSDWECGGVVGCFRQRKCDRRNWIKSGSVIRAHGCSLLVGRAVSWFTFLSLSMSPLLHSMTKMSSSKKRRRRNKTTKREGANKTKRQVQPHGGDTSLPFLPVGPDILSPLFQSIHSPP